MQMNGGWKLTIGELTRQHKGLIVMEELQGCDFEPHRALTDLRSSGLVRLVRVGSTLKVPTVNRRLTISNPKSPNIDIRSYLNGMKVVQELVKKPEDIARYDVICLPDPKLELIRPNEKKPTPYYDKSLYIKKMKWLWSRKAKDVKIKGKKVLDTLWEETIKLNQKYENNTQLLGRETDLKLLRLSCAVAGMVLSTDENFEKIILCPERILWASHFLDGLYGNKIFRLDDYVQQQKRYAIATKEDFDYFVGITQENAETTSLVRIFANFDGIIISHSYLQTMWDNKYALNNLLSIFMEKHYLRNFRPKEYLITERFRKILNCYRE